MTPRLLLVALPLLSLAACSPQSHSPPVSAHGGHGGLPGGQASPPPPPASPAQAGVTSRSPSSPENPAAGTTAPAPTAFSSSGKGTTDQRPPAEIAPADLPSALRVFDDEAKALSGSLSSCTTACRSLGSMERAARVICELTRDGEPGRCEVARQKLREARERVRLGCGACEGGPRTDPSAPAP